MTSKSLEPHINRSAFREELQLEYDFGQAMMQRSISERTSHSQSLCLPIPPADRPNGLPLAAAAVAEPGSCAPNSMVAAAWDAGRPAEPRPNDAPVASPGSPSLFNPKPPVSCCCAAPPRLKAAECC